MRCKYRFGLALILGLLARAAALADWRSVALSTHDDSWNMYTAPGTITTMNEVINLRGHFGGASAADAQARFLNSNIGNPHVQYDDNGQWLIQAYGDNDWSEPTVCDAIYVVTYRTDGSFSIPSGPALSFPPMPTCAYLGASTGLTKTLTRTATVGTVGGFKYFAIVPVQDTTVTPSKQWIAWAVSSDGQAWAFEAASGGVTADPRLSRPLIHKADLTQGKFWHVVLLYNKYDNRFYMIIGYEAVGITATWWRMTFDSTTTLGRGAMQRLSVGGYQDTDGTIPINDQWQFDAQDLTATSDMTGTVQNPAGGSIDPMDLVQLYKQDGSFDSMLYIYDSQSSAQTFNTRPPLIHYSKGALPATGTANFAWSPAETLQLPTEFTAKYSDCGGGGLAFAVNQSGWQPDGSPQLYGFVATRDRKYDGMGASDCGKAAQGLVKLKWNLMSSTLTTSATVPQIVGTPVHLIASATGGDAVPYQYRFWVYPIATGGPWTMVQDYSTNSNLAWTPTSPGSYYTCVWVRRAGSTALYDTWTSGPTACISAASPTVSAFIASPASPQHINTRIHWSATATGGVGPLKYQFWVYNPNSAVWAIAQPYSNSSTFDWTPTQSGTYTIAVWVLNASSCAAYDTVGSGSDQIIP